MVSQTKAESAPIFASSVRSPSPSSSSSDSLRALETLEGPSQLGLSVVGRGRSNTTSSFEFRPDLFPLTLSEVDQGVDQAIEKNVGLLNGIGLVVGSQVGSGIFSSPGVVFANAQSVGASLLVWLVSGILAWTGASSFAELGSAIPLSGGAQAYLAYAYNPLVGFLYSWTAISALRPGSSAIVALIFGEYVMRLFYSHDFNPEDIPKWQIKAMGCVCVIMSFVLCVGSPKLGPRAAVFLTTIKLAALILVATLGLVQLIRGKASASLKEPLFTGTSPNPSSFALALYSGLWAFEGWDATNYVTGEMKNVETVLPRIIHSSMSIVLTLFLSANVSYFIVLEKWHDFARRALCGFFTSSRLVYASVQEGFLPSFFGRLNQRFKTPLNATALHSLLTVFFMLVGGGFRTLINFYSVAVWGFYFLTVMGLLVLRVKEPNLDRPYKTWLVTPVTFSAVALFLLLMPVAAAPLEAAAAFGFILLGLPVYYLTRPRPRDAPRQGSGIIGVSDTSQVVEILTNGLADRIFSSCLRVARAGDSGYVRAAADEDEQVEMLQRLERKMQQPSFDEIARMLDELNMSPQEFTRAAAEPDGMHRLLARMTKPSMMPTFNDSEQAGDHMLAQIQQAKATALREKSLPPFRYTPPPRAAFSFSLEAKRQERERQQASGQSQIVQTYIGTRPHVSRLSLDELSRVNLSDMDVRKVHLGKYLLCRIISLPARVFAVQFGVEDPRGSVTMVSLYGFPGTLGASMKTLDALFPLGWVLAIKEPYLKEMSTGGGAHIRVDCASDLLFLDSDHPSLGGVQWMTRSPASPLTAITSPDAWKELGNQYFKDTLYFPAAVTYSRGLQHYPTAYLLRLNRAMAYIRLGYFGAALADCRHIMDLPSLTGDVHLKALYRAAQAKYGLGWWDGALSMFQDVVRLYPSESELCSGWIEKCTKRKQEAELGHETYIAFNFLNNRMQNDCSAILDHKVVEQLIGDPSRSSALYDLYAGPEEASPPPTYSIPDHTAVPIEHLPQSDVDVDASRIQGITTYNAFEPTTLKRRTAALEQTDKKKGDGPSALFLLPSLFNHSCAPNARWYCFGDTMVIRAVCATGQGEEIYLAYGGQGLTYLTRDKDAGLTKFLGTCRCNLCLADREDGLTRCKQRESIIKNIKSRNTVGAAKKEVEALKKTYKEAPNGEGMWGAISHLAILHMRNRDPTGFIRETMQAIGYAGVTVRDKSIRGTQHVTDGLPIDLRQNAMEPNTFFRVGEEVVDACMAVSDTFQDQFSDDVRGKSWEDAAVW
ncbi:hypothetical protein FRB99_008474, partial [Tulasnella sp. 403]